jgi:hypothetical protein
MASPLIGSYFRKMGVLPAAPDSIASALEAGHDGYVERKYDEVQQSIQDGMDTLARRRAFPVFG